MKKTFYLVKNLFIVIAFISFFAGCEKDFNTVIDTDIVDYQVTSINSFETFAYTPGDSLITLNISFNNSAEISSVSADIYSSENKQLNNSSLFLLDNGNLSNGDTVAGDKKFSARFPLSQYYPNGKYQVKYFVTDISEITKQVAVQSFNFNNSQDNIPPVIFNSVIEPDTVDVNDTTFIFTSVTVVDSNGQNDIEEVYFIVYRPNGTTNNNKLFLFDDGSCCPIPPSNTVSGDQLPNDGIFSRVIQVDQSNTKGVYRFEFQAKDRGGKLSNILNHFVEIK